MRSYKLPRARTCFLWAPTQKKTFLAPALTYPILNDKKFILLARHSLFYFYFRPQRSLQRKQANTKPSRVGELVMLNFIFKWYNWSNSRVLTA
jgi:hypothetical protein